LKGDWKHGYIWNDSNGNPITDVGGNMLKLLSDLNVPWKPLLRSNKQELHPLWFGLYEDIVYHHGAAFRDPTSRADVAALNSFDRLCFNLLKKLPTQIRKFIPNQYQPLYKIAKNNKELSENVFKTIQSDPEFFRYFMK
jgi:hypothetical protein